MGSDTLDAATEAAAMRSIIDTPEERDARIRKIIAGCLPEYLSYGLELAIRKALIEAQSDAGDRVLASLKVPPLELPITAAEVEAAQR